MDEAIELALSGRSPYPDKSAFIGADTTHAVLGARDSYDSFFIDERPTVGARKANEEAMPDGDDIPKPEPRVLACIDP